MTETPQDAVPQSPDDIWHIDFHLSRTGGAVSPYYLNCQIARSQQPWRDNEFKLEGMATFEAPAIVPPRVGQELVPYLLYHLDMVREWLMAEHVSMAWNGNPRIISSHVGLPPVTAPQVDED